MQPPTEATTSQNQAKRGIIFCVALVAIWAFENFLVQAAAFDTPVFTRHPVIYSSVRLLVNVLAAAFVVVLVPRPGLFALVTIDTIASVFIVAHDRYFHHAPSIYSTMNLLKESERVASVVFEMVPPTIWILFIVGLVAKLLSIWKMPAFKWSLRLRIAAGCAVALGATLITLQYTSFGFRELRSNGTTRCVYVCGYIDTWLVESCILPDTRGLARELATLHDSSPDRLKNVGLRWNAADHVAIVQLESYGWNVLNYRINGQEVSPFINSLARNGEVFRVQSYHDMNSADMDYATLSGGRPSSRMTSYTIHDFPYTNALPEFFHQHGFHTAGFHGNSGSFFQRRSNFQRMTFDEIWFKEDFERSFGAKTHYGRWGVRDDDLLQLSAKKMREAKGPEFHFLITLDSHIPFDFIDDSEKEIYPHSSDWQENYFNSVRVLDHAVKHYIESLPAGTLVIFYGDHTPGVNYGDFHCAREGNAEYVPCIVYVTGAHETLAKVDTEKLPGDLRIHDVVNNLRRVVATGHVAKR